MELRRFLRNRDGVAALEFALILPLLTVLTFGVLELYFSFNTAQKISLAAQQTADLVSQADQQTSANLEDIREATRQVLEPLPTGATVLGIDIASLGIDTAGETPRVLWRSTNGLSSSLDPANADGLVEPGGSVIWVGVRYKYTAPISLVLSSYQYIEHQAFSTPRVTRRIALDGDLEH